MEAKLQERITDLRLSSIPWTTIAVLAGIYFLLQYAFGVSQAPNEPPLAASPLPYLVHTIGLLRHKMKYYVQLSEKHQDPIYAVSMMGGKVYVANQPELVSAIYRNNRQLSFSNLAAEVVSRLSVASKKTTQILLDNVTGERGDKGYSPEGYKAMHSALSPGPSLDKINASIIPDVAAAVDRLDPGTGSKRINLYSWVRHTITVATSNAVYGPHNPFKEPEIHDAFWCVEKFPPWSQAKLTTIRDFENRLTVLLLGVLPWLFGRSAHNGRTRVRRSFEEYFGAGYQNQGSDLVRWRHDVAVRNGVEAKDIAGLETTMAIGVLANTAPAGFWTVWHIFAYPSVLAEIRVEAEKLVTVSVAADGSTLRSVDLKRISSECPVLISTWHEVLRHIGCGTSARLVREDMMVADRYFLRKNNVVQMPSQVVHGRAHLWKSAGAAPVEDFDSRRFMKIKPAQGAYRPFGGGITLCPGRHLSATEIQALVVMMVLRYELKPANGQAWVKPDLYLTSFASAIVSPRQDPLVDISARKGWEGGKWAFTIPESKS